MMAAKKLQSLSVTTYLFVTIFLCMLTSQTESKVSRRQTDCQDGEYLHEERKCCKCPAGNRVEKHCTHENQTECVACPKMQFHREANDGMNCDVCSLCDHRHVNMEVDRPCTPYDDSTCKCKAKHYCSGTNCVICEPCLECGPEGEKVACSATNNTICNDKPQDPPSVGIALGIIIPVVLVAAGAGVACHFWKKRNSSQNPGNGVECSELHRPLRSDERELPQRLGPFIPDIAEVITWPTVRNLALHYQIPNGRIESCKLNHPNNGVEHVIELLKIFEESRSKTAAKDLVQYLRNTKQNSSADNVVQILHSSSTSA